VAAGNSKSGRRARESEAECFHGISLENVAAGHHTSFGWADAHLKTKVLKPANEGGLELLGVSPIEVIGPKTVIWPLILEHMEYDDQDAVSQSNNCALFAFPCG